MYDMLALYEAKNVQDAVRLRLEHPEAQIIAGGTDVLVQMREGKRAGKALISIQKCDEMRGVSIDAEENIRIGSLTSFTHITNDPIIQQYINVLGEAVDMVGGPQIRNAGTIGGNTCNGVTSADSASTLHAWEAIVEITGKNGVRRVPIKDFYIKAGTVICGRRTARSRPPSSSPRRPTTGRGDIILNTPCATPWISPRWVPLSTPGSAPTARPSSGCVSPLAWPAPCLCGRRVRRRSSTARP